MEKTNKLKRAILTIVLSLVSISWIFPVLLVVINAFKKKTSISLEPFALPTEKSFVGLENYIKGIEKVEFFKYFGYSLFITVGSVALILLFCSMCGWYMARVKNKMTMTLKFLMIFAMVIPFQMVMFTLAKTADTLGLNTPWGIILVYLGFGAGMAVFMFSNFTEGMPVEIEEAAFIDGCTRWQTYWKIVFPLLKPTIATVAIIDAMAFWNDYLLPSLVLGRKELYTLPIATQAFYGTYSTDLGLVMAALLLAMLPILVLYLFLQRYIVEGVTSGAVKG